MEESTSPAVPGSRVIALRVVVRAADLEAFITRYSKHLQGDRIFIFTKTPQPVGTRVRFRLQLADGEELIVGKGTVTRVQNDSSDARHPPGMELVFVTLDERSQTIVDFMHATRAGDVQAVLATKLPPIPAAAAPPPIPQKPAAALGPVAPSLPSIPQKLAEALGPVAQSEPLSPGPAPAMAEVWRDPLPPGPPAAGSTSELPANPFGDISEGAIEYFVEWSIDQSIGATVETKTQFSNVSMSLPAITPGEERALRRKRALPVWWLAVAGFVVGVPVGGLLWALSSHTPPRAAASHTQAPPTVATTPAADLPSAPAVPTAAPTAPAPVAALAPLTIASHPPGATLTVDGKPADHTPATLEVASGPHEVVVSKERYATITQHTSAPGSLTVELKRPSLTLEVQSRPPAALVQVGGVPRGKTPLTLHLPGYESYQVQVVLAGADPWKRPVYLKGRTTRVTAVLTMRRRR